jgi:hypothetical protein
MKKYFLSLCCVAAISFVGCKNNNDTSSSSSTVAGAKEQVELPMPMAYQGDASVSGNAELVTVMKWNKFLSNKQLDSAFALLADSVTVRLADGTEYNTTVDSMKKVMTGFMDAITKANIQYITAVPITVQLAGRKDQWVLSWTDEEYTMKTGPVQHNAIHEDYQLVNGKIRTINQFARTIPAKK